MPRRTARSQSWTLPKEMDPKAGKNRGANRDLWNYGTRVPKCVWVPVGHSYDRGTYFLLGTYPRVPWYLLQ